MMLLWQKSIVEIDHGLYTVFGPHFIGKSLGTLQKMYLDFGHLSDTPVFGARVTVILLPSFINLLLGRCYIKIKIKE